MRTTVNWLVLSFMLLPCDAASALTIQVEGGTGSSIPEIVHLDGDPLPLSITVQLYNESDTNPVTLALWQLQLVVIPDISATGAVELSQVLAPDTPFFDSPGPAAVPPDALPGTDVLVQDTDMPPPPILPGKSLNPEEARDIAKLEFSSPNDAAGTFYLVLGAFDVQTPLSGSVWLDGLLTPMPFANTPGQDIPGEITLAKLLFGIQEADFSEDGNVDAADLAIWQSGFGMAPGAKHKQGDSDGDGDVDGTDFLMWQRQFESTTGLVGTQIPEPNPFLLAIIALTTLSFTRRWAFTRRQVDK